MEADTATDALGEALKSWVEELEHLVDEDGAAAAPWADEARAPVFGQPQQRSFPLVDARSVSAGVYRAGALAAATEAFRTAGCDAWIDRDVLDRLAKGGAPAFVADTGGLTAYAPGAETSTWRLPAEIHQAAQKPGSVVVLTTVIADQATPLRDACWAYGLSGLQTRVALEAIRTGSLKDAARSLSISYQTAREALADALRRVGAQRLPGLVTRLTTLAFGVLPGRGDTRDVLADVWGLTGRQIAVAGLIAEGLPRERVAALVGVSAALVKKELETAYQLLQVSSGAALARKIVEARAMGWLTAATAGGAGFVEDHAEPLRFALRPDGGRIAFSDYGPASGRPILVVHSSMSTRIVSRKLLRALHAAGYRPIAIDRPGFGLSDPIPLGAGVSPFVAATGDVPIVLDLLKIDRADLVSRGAAQFLVALTAAAPDRIGRVVLVNPGPPYAHSGRGLGPLGVIKAAFINNPDTVRPVADFIASQLTYRRAKNMLSQWTRGSAPDQLAALDPEFVTDFYRSVRMFATGRYDGFLAEQRAISTAGRPPPYGGASGWRVLLGASDMLYDPEVVLAYWRELLPGAEFDVVPDGGRFLAMTHPNLVVDALAA